MSVANKGRFIMLGRLSPQLSDWREEFTTPLMREAVLRTVKDALAEQGEELEFEEPSAHWHKSGKLVNDTTIGSTPCWVWWVK